MLILYIDSMFPVQELLHFILNSFTKDTLGNVDVVFALTQPE